MADNKQDPTFSEVFGLRQPSIEEVREIFDTLSFAIENLSAPIGCTALFGVPGMPEEIMELSRQLGISYADDGSVEQEKAIEIATVMGARAEEMLKYNVQHHVNNDTNIQLYVLQTLSNACREGKQEAMAKKYETLLQQYMTVLGG